MATTLATTLLTIAMTLATTLASIATTLTTIAMWLLWTPIGNREYEVSPLRLAHTVPVMATVTPDPSRSINLDEPGPFNKILARKQQPTVKPRCYSGAGKVYQGVTTINTGTTTVLPRSDYGSSRQAKVYPGTTKVTPRSFNVWPRFVQVDRGYCTGKQGVTTI